MNTQSSILNQTKPNAGASTTHHNTNSAADGAHAGAWQVESIGENGAPGAMKKFPMLLRTLGAAALVIAIYSFLVQGWQNGNDVLRYLLLLAHTGALAAIGLASGHWLKESKGARLLLSLALVAVPANFAILGAFIFSQTAAKLGDYPHYVAWHVDSLQSALLTTGGALLILTPVVLLGFSVLARSLSKNLSLLFLISNAALLLPLRDPQLIGLLGLALCAITLILNRSTATQHSAAKTQEGVTALALQFLPLAVLMGRSLWLYSADFFLMSALSVSVFLILRQTSFYFENDSTTRHTLDLLSVIPAISSGLWFACMLSKGAAFPDALVLPVGTFTTAVMVYDIAARNQNNGGLYRRIAVSTLLLGMLVNLLFFSGQLAAFACLVTGIMLLLRGYRARQRSLFSGGAVLTTAGLLHQVYQLVHHFDLGGWTALTALGISAIVIASVMESQSGNIRVRMETWKAKLQAWEM